MKKLLSILFFLMHSYSFAMMESDPRVLSKPELEDRIIASMLDSYMQGEMILRKKGVWFSDWSDSNSVYFFPLETISSAMNQILEMMKAGISEDEAARAESSFNKLYNNAFNFNEEDAKNVQIVRFVNFLRGGDLPNGIDIVTKNQIMANRANYYYAWTGKQVDVIKKAKHNLFHAPEKPYELLKEQITKSQQKEMHKRIKRLLPKKCALLEHLEENK